MEHTLEYTFTDESMRAQMTSILSAAKVGSGDASVELYALVLPDNSDYIDHRSPPKDFAAWNGLAEMELVSHPEADAEVHGSSLRRLQQEVLTMKQQSRKSGEDQEKTAVSVADAVRRSVSIFSDLKKKNRATDAFMWSLLTTKYSSLELCMDILSSLQPGSSLHREILHTLSVSLAKGKNACNLFLANDAPHTTRIVELLQLQNKSIATVKIALLILLTLLRASSAYAIIKGCIKQVCRSLSVPQWSILVTLLAENDVDLRFNALSLIYQLARATNRAASDKLSAKTASTKFFLKMEIAGVMKGLSILAASSNAEELKLVDKYTDLSQNSPIPRSWRDCEVLKQKLTAVEDKCLNLEEQVTQCAVMTCSHHAHVFVCSCLRVTARARLRPACRKSFSACRSSSFRLHVAAAPGI
jgi:hypothetical protein